MLASNPKNSGFSFGRMPAVGFTVRRIDYRDAPSCRGRRNLHPANCPLVGYTPPGEAPTPESIQRPLKVRSTGHRVEVKFPAPVAVRDARSFYTLLVQFQRGQGCRGAGASVVTDRNVAKGATVRMHASLQAKCRGRVEGVVSYVTAAPSGPMGPAPGDPANPVVGRFTHELR